MMHDTHCAPLERGNFDISYSIDIEDLYRARYSLA